ncbi:MAG: DinB family protein [Pirellulaceae bacterium]
MSLSSLVEQYAAGTEVARQAVAGLSREQLLARPVPGKWSTLEVVCHLADFEIVYVDRLAAVIAEHEPALPGRDEQAFASRLAYHDRDLGEQLHLIQACRSHMTRVLRTLTDADLARRGIHTEAGPLTLQQLLGRSIEHVVHHVQFIHEKRQALQF